MSTASRVIKNTGFLYIRIGITMFVALWTTRIVLDALGDSGFGIYSLVGGVVTMLGFLNASLSGATQRFINFSEGKKDEEGKIIIFNNSLTLHMLLAICLVVLLIGVGFIAFRYFLDIPPESLFAAKCVYGFMICTMALSVINVPYEAEINAHEEMGVYAGIGIIDAFLKLAIAFTIKYVETDRLILYGALTSVIPLVTLLILRGYCHKNYKECRFHPVRYYRKEVIRKLSGFAGWNFLNTASGIFSQSGLNIVINHFFDVALNAAQGITNQVGNALMNLSSNVEKALNPIIVKREGANQREGMLYVSLLGCRMTFFVFSFFSIFVITEMSPILSLWLKKVPAWTVIFCQLQLIRVAVELLTRGIHTAIMAQGDIKWYCIIRSTTNILPLIVTPLAFYYGLAPYWMYIVWIISWSILGGLTSLWFARRNIGLGYDTYCNAVLFPALKSILPAIILIILCKCFISNQAIQLIAVIIANLIFAGLSVIYLFTQAERNELKRLINKLKKR